MKNICKLFAAFLFTFLTVAFIKSENLTAFAATEYTEGYYTYTVENGEATITSVDTSIEEDITIPSAFSSYPVTAIGAYLFQDCGELTSITIPDSVRSIGEDAFSGCDNLTTIKYDGTKEDWNKIDIGSGFPNDITIICLKENGWKTENEKQYYYLNGIKQTGWLELDGARYYFNQNGEMQVGWVVIDEVKYLFDNKGKCVEGAHSFVIDISQWQRNIDWDKLKATLVDAVILRSSIGGKTAEDYNKAKDSNFVEYIENLNRLEIPYGVYHFNTATTVEIAKIQAQNVIRILKESGANPIYPVFVDIETNGGNCDLIAIAKVYMEIFIENGYKPGIYANQNYWENYLNHPEFNAYYKWIANYGINNGYPSATFTPKDGIGNYAIWQYTSLGRIDGMTENTTDLNALFDWYYKPDGLVEINGKKFLYKDGYLKSGWADENGDLIYLKPSGEMAVGWLKLDETWYYFNNDGKMATGWLQLGTTWYYLNSDGEMQTGWLKLENTWYYLKDSGAMATGWLQDGGVWYYLSPGGAMQTGWLKLGGTWYYLNDNGSMQTGWLKLGDTWYYLSTNGAMATGWLKLGSTWYYLNQSGAMQTGWLKLGNTWYYLKDSGAMATGSLKIGNKWYNFNSSGAWIG